MIGGRPSLRLRAAALLFLLPCLPTTAGCTHAVDGIPSAAPPPPVPASSQELGKLVVTEVPSGLPRLPDDQLEPPAGPKAVDDIADYSDDPARERDVLEEYGYRFGWERFWGTGSVPTTGVFVDQFDTRSGAASYAEDLAGNDAQHYGAVVHENPPELPGGCRMLTVDDEDAQEKLGGAAAFAWCARGPFSVSVTSVTDSLETAESEVRAVVGQQLDRLPS